MQRSKVFLSDAQWRDATDLRGTGSQESSVAGRASRQTEPRTVRLAMRRQCMPLNRMQTMHGGSEASRLGGELANGHVSAAHHSDRHGHATSADGGRTKGGQQYVMHAEYGYADGASETTTTAWGHKISRTRLRRS